MNSASTTYAAADDNIGTASIVVLLLLVLAFAVAPTLAVSAAAALVAAIFVVRTLDRPLLGLLAMLPAATLDVMGRLAQVGGVQFTIYQLLALLTLIAVVLGVKRGSVQPAPSPVDLPVLLFLAFVLSAIPLASEPRLALVSAASLVSSAVLLFLTIWTVRDVDTARKVLIAVALVALVLGGLALLERLHIFAIQGKFLATWRAGIRARVTFKDPNILATFLGPSSLLCAAWAFAEKDKIIKLGMVAASAAAFMGVLTTMSRGALGGWLAGVAVVLAFSKMSAKTRATITSLVVAAIMFVAFVVLDPRWVQAKIVGIAGDAPALSRLWMARSALQAFADNPLGVGPGHYPIVFPLYRDASVRLTLVESHTAYLTILVEIGILGFLAFLWMLWRYFTRLIAATQRTADPQVHALIVGALAAGVALSAQAFTYSLESSKILWFTLGMGMAAYTMSRLPGKTVPEGRT